MQHFQIGSAGRDSISNEEPIRTACVININPASEKIELLNAFYDGTNNKWSFDECERSFPLRPKYCQDDKQEKTIKDKKVTIKAKSTDEKIIKAEIDGYFNIEANANIELYPIKYNSATIKKELDNAYKNRDKKKVLFVIIYRIKTNNNNICTIETEDIKHFKEMYMLDIICNRLVIKEIDIIVPNLVFL